MHGLLNAMKNFLYIIMYLLISQVIVIVTSMKSGRIVKHLESTGQNITLHFITAYKTYILSINQKEVQQEILNAYSDFI